MVGFIETVGKLIELLLGNERTKIINVIVAYRNRRLRSFLFPRWTRLPINYVKHFQDKDKTIKPGSSEMAGLIVTVDKEVFEFSEAQNVREALDYVSSSEEDLKFIYDYLNKQGIKNAEESFNQEFPFLKEKVDGLWKKGIKNGFVRAECLKGIETKSYEDGLIEVQYNKRRKSIVSFSRVEKRKKGEEKCPYCSYEKGREDYPWNNYIISANPYPYYDHHIVIVNKKHIDQFIDQNEVRIMVEFVLNAPEYMVVYNGPPGTTILSHMHFQAGIHSLPVERAKTKTLATDGNLTVAKLLNFPTRGFVVEKHL